MNLLASIALNFVLVALLINVIRKYDRSQEQLMELEGDVARRKKLANYMLEIAQEIQDDEKHDKENR